MKTGTYRLRSDFVTPNAAGVSDPKDWRELPYVPAGTQFHVYAGDHESSLRPVGGSGVPGMGHVFWSTPGWATMFGMLERVPDTLELVLDRHPYPWPGARVLQALVDMRRVSLGDVQEALQYLDTQAAQGGQR